MDSAPSPLNCRYLIGLQVRRRDILMVGCYQALSSQSD